MTRRKQDVIRHFRPERASRETMAYLLDMSTDTFDRLVGKGALPPAGLIAGVRRWNVAATLAAWDGVDGTEEKASDSPACPADEMDPFMAGVEEYRDKERRRRTA
jgi:hypothetical protein